MRALNRFRFPLLALGLAFAFGCSADSPSSPTAPPTNPVPPSVGINVSVSSSTATLEAGSTAFATLVVRATRADNGQAVANLTPGTITTTLGSFGSADGPQTVAVEMVNGQATVVLFPGTTVGSASIRASVSSGVGFTSVGIREPGIPPTFFLSSVSPSTGSPQGGDTVTINGGGFDQPIRATFDGIPAVVLSATATQIRVTTPRCGANGCFEAGAITPVTVSVTINLNEEGQASDSLASGFSYVNGGGGGGTLQPSIFSVTPSSGPNEGGTQVTINGDGFEAPVSVKFGTGTADADFNGAEAQVISVTRTRIVVLAPATSCAGCAPPTPNQLASILIKNQNSGRFTVASAAFRYGSLIRITSMGPTVGPMDGGQLVTIFGLGFDSPAAVSFTGCSGGTASSAIAQQVISVSGSEIVVRTTGVQPSTCGDIVCSGVRVVNIGNGESDDAPIGYRYDLPDSATPLVSGVSPSTGPQAGGNALTVIGANFESPIVVVFEVGGQSFTAIVGTVTATSIRVTGPAVPNEVFLTQACEVSPGPPAVTGTKYIPTPANVTVTNPVNTCTVTSPGAYTYIPTDVSCRPN